MSKRKLLIERFRKYLQLKGYVNILLIATSKNGVEAEIEELPSLKDFSQVGRLDGTYWVRLYERDFDDVSITDNLF